MHLLELHYNSAAIHQATNVNILLPARAEQPYKTLYLLHGHTDDYSCWERRTALELFAEKHDLAVVMPSGHESYYSDMVSGRSYYTYLTEELPTYLESILPLAKEPENRFIGGLSMGGYGSMKAALKTAVLGHPMYSAVICLSPVGDIAWHMATTKQEHFGWIFGEDFKVPEDDDLLKLAAKLKDSPRKPRVYLAGGFDDPIYCETKTLGKALEDANFDLMRDDGPGAHNWFFWNEHIEKGIEWLYK